MNGLRASLWASPSALSKRGSFLTSTSNGSLQDSLFIMLICLISCMCMCVHGCTHVCKHVCVCACVRTHMCMPNYKQQSLLIQRLLTVTSARIHLFWFFYYPSNISWETFLSVSTTRHFGEIKQGHETCESEQQVWRGQTRASARNRLLLVMSEKNNL